MPPTNGYPDLALPVRGRDWRVAVALAMTARCATVGWGVYAVALQHYVATRAEEAGQRTTFHAQSLHSTLARCESLPRLMTLEHVLHAVLQENPHVGNAVTRRAANAYLKEVQAATDLAVVRLINMTGLAIVANNRGLPTLLVDQNYAFRPYFAEAARKGSGRFYGVGNTTGETGCLAAASVREDNKPVGVVVMKISLDTFEATLSRNGGTVLLVDRHGMISLSLVLEWKYHTLNILSTDQRVVPDTTH